MARRTIDPVDTIWLNMDRPDNLMVIESLILLDGPVDWSRFCRTFEERVLDRYPVFRRRPVASVVPGALPHWEDVPDFELADHLRHAELSEPGDDAALQDYVTRSLSVPLRRDKPLWELHLVDGYRGGAALYSRLHHAMADGLALLQVLLSMTDPAPGGGGEPEPEAEAEAAGGLARAARVAEQAALGVPRLLDATLARDALSLARETTRITTKLLLTRNPRTAIAGEVGVPKRAIWAPPLPLPDVVDAAHRTGTTVNDILVAALAGALHRYQDEEGERPVDIPTMVPVNVRPSDEPLPRDLGNRFALVVLELPSGLATPFGRLAETKRRMDQIKHSPEAVLTFGLIRGIGRTGPLLERPLVDFFANEASGVTTNVPGPRAPRYLAGTRVAGLLGWAPESGDQTLGTCIVTYAGQVWIGFKVDALRVPRVESLLDGYLREVAALTELAPPSRRTGRRGSRRTGASAARRPS